MTKFFKVAVALFLSLTLTSCGSSISAKDLAACDGAWDSVSTAISSAPRATYSDSAPDPTFEEKMDHFMVLVDSQSEIRSLASTLDLGEFQLALMELSLGIGAMSLCSPKPPCFPSPPPPRQPPHSPATPGTHSLR